MQGQLNSRSQRGLNFAFRTIGGRGRGGMSNEGIKSNPTPANLHIYCGSEPQVIGKNSWKIHPQLHEILRETKVFFKKIFELHPLPLCFFSIFCLNNHNLILWELEQFPSKFDSLDTLSSMENVVLCAISFWPTYN